MKLLILCHNLHTAGGYTIGINFVRSLRAINTSHKFLITVPTDVGYENIELPENSELYIYKGGRNLFRRWQFDCYGLPAIIKKYNPHAIFALGLLGVTGLPYKQALLFDDSHLIYPRAHYKNETPINLFKKWLVKKRLQQCLRFTQLVFCQTPVTKTRFAKLFNYPLNQIKIMPNAVSEFAKNPEMFINVPEVLRAKNYFNMFLLAKFYAHKNFELLLDIFKNGRDKLRDVRCIITISPEQHSKAAMFLKNISKYNLQDHIINVGPLKQKELAAYFCNTDILFFPTLLESFTATYLEAMHFGLPILTSDLDFAHYICSDAAIYFNPFNVTDAIEKIDMLKNNTQLRQELTQKGKIRMKSFFRSWQDVTAETLREIELLACQG